MRCGFQIRITVAAHIFSECPRCLQFKDVVEDNLHAVFAGFYDNLDGVDTGAANLEEVVGGTHLLDFQNIGEDVAEEFFLLTLWRLILGDTLHLRYGQYLAVNLSVGCHRHGIHLHIGIRHHVFCQRRSSKGLTDVIVSKRCTCFQCVI